MTLWTLAWLTWLLAFLVIECFAVFNKMPGDTLSEHVWAWASIKTKGGHWRLRRLILLAFLAWLALHMLTGGEF